jgi:serine protease Do
MKKRNNLKIFLIGVFIFLIFGSATGLYAQEIFQDEVIADVAQKAIPSVVNIASSKEVTVEEPLFLFDPFFSLNIPKKRTARALGSGVIMSEDGYIVTNYHVIGEADKVEVRLSDGRTFAANIIGGDPKSDIAVIKIDAKDLPVMPLGDTSKLRIGTIVLAVGNPFGLSQTVTMGIISALGRSGLGITDYENFIQTDAAINPGNSGGALVNLKGELIGINTAILSETGGNVGVGFTIPVDLALSVMNSLIKHGKVIRGWLGVTVQDITPEIAKAMNLNSTKGVLIAGVEENSPAEKGGVRKGDVILELNSKPVINSSELRIRIAELPPGTQAKLKVLRDGKETELNVTAGDLSGASISMGEFEILDNKILGGATVSDITDVAREKLELPQKLQGTLVLKVENGSAAASIVRPGDVIMEIDNKETKNVEELKKVLSGSLGHKISVKIYRRGSVMRFSIVR